MSEFAQVMARARRRSEGNMAESIAAALADDDADDDDKTTTATTPTEPTPTKTPTVTKTWSQQHIKSTTAPTAPASSTGETKTSPTKSRRKSGGIYREKTTSRRKSYASHVTSYVARFEELTQLSIVGQAEAFLMQFVMEFRGRFAEITDMALEFQSFAGPLSKGEHVQELDEFQTHRFLEKRGETLTVSHMRDKLREIDIDSNGMIAFLEYLLFKYDKTLEDMFTDSADGVDPELLKALHEAMEAFKKVAAAKAKRMKIMDKLKAKAAKGGVLGKSAAHELECMLREDETERNRQEITAAAAQRRAKKAVKNADKSDMKKKALEAEKKKQEEEEKKKKREEKTKRQESRARLAAKAAMFSN